MVHLVAWAVGLSVFRIGLVAPQSCPELSVADLDIAIAATADWATSNLEEDGVFAYRYNRVTGEDLGGYNVTRHAAMTNALYQVAAVDEDLRWLEPTDRSLQYMLDNLDEYLPTWPEPFFKVERGPDDWWVNVWIARGWNTFGNGQWIQ